jgi:hypothetical protein
MSVFNPPTALHPGYVSGKWYGPQIQFNAASAQLPTGKIRFLPYYNPAPFTADQLGVSIATVAAGGNVRAALYGSTPPGTDQKMTGPALVSTGDMSTAALYAVTAPALAPGYVPQGVIWLAVMADATAGGTVILESVSGGFNLVGGLVGGATLAELKTAIGNLGYAYNFDQAFGTFPDMTGQTITKVVSNVAGIVNWRAA